MNKGIILLIICISFLGTAEANAAGVKNRLLHGMPNNNRPILKNLAVKDKIIYKGLPLYYWQQKSFVNFGDYLSLVLVERIVGMPVGVHRNYPKNTNKAMLAIGSIISFARDGDLIWGSGINGKLLNKSDYKFKSLDVRAVRGPLSRQFLWDIFEIAAPEIYGDPALLIPQLFPEFVRAKDPKYPYIIISHYSENHLFPRDGLDNIVYATDPWQEVLGKILASELVISSSLHGVILAEAYGIPARLLRITETEPLFKFKDYFLGTNRPDFKYATSVDEALTMGGEKPFCCDLQKLYDAFPLEFWPEAPKAIDVSQINGQIRFSNQ